MNKENCDKLLRSIKADDVATFTNIFSLTKNMNYCFGRFPVLSLCYMYNAKKIIKKHEKTLILVQKYEKIDEPLQLYMDFRKFAGKSLRLYVDGESVVYPLEMLAILHQDKKVKKLYKYVYKNTQSVDNVLKVYGNFYDQNIKKTSKGLQISSQPLSYYQYRITKFSTVFSAVFLAFVLALFFVVDLTCGLGVLGQQKIYSSRQFVAALNSGGTFVLQNDISLKLDGAIEKFSGQINGNGKTIFVDYCSDMDGIINQNDGTIENVNIVYKNIPTSILTKSSQCLLCVINNGNIKNVSISFLSDNDDKISLTLQKQAEKDNYFAIFAIQNSGAIEDCSAMTKIVATDSGTNGEAYISGFVGENSGSVKNCIMLENSIIETTNIDVAGIAIKNKTDATITDSKNFALLKQNCTIEQWSPTVGGIACENMGTILGCRNMGELSVQSNIVYADQSNAASLFLGGIVARNTNIIQFCKNTGNLIANCADYGAYVGGIVGYSMDSQNYTYIQNCIHDAEINVSIENDDIRKFIGGIAGFVVGSLNHNISVGTYQNGYNVDKNNYVGLFVGMLLYDFWGNLYVFDSHNNYVYQSQTDVVYRVGCVIGNGTGALITGDNDSLNSELNSLAIVSVLSNINNIKALEEWYE